MSTIGLSMARLAFGIWFLSTKFMTTKSDDGDGLVSQIRLNCGEDSDYSYQDSYGNMWISDYEYIVSNINKVRSASRDDSISNSNNNNDKTVDDVIYQSERWTGSGDIEYKFNNLIPSNTYTVIIHLAEIYYDESGKRTIGLIIQNKQIVSDFDIHDNVGHDTAMTFVQNGVELNEDNTLDIIVVNGEQNPKISGIEIIMETASPTRSPTVLPTSSPHPSSTSIPTESESNGESSESNAGSPGTISVIRLNCGEDTQQYSYQDSDGNTWVGDSDYIVSNTDVAFGHTTGDDISNINNNNDNTVDQTIYQSERWVNDNNLEYKINDLITSTYTVIIHLAELYFEASGQRSIGLYIQNEEILSNYDIFGNVGHDVAMTIIKTGVEVNDDNTLDIIVTRYIENPKINGIEIIMQGTPSPSSPTSEPTQQSESSTEEEEEEEENDVSVTILETATTPTLFPAIRLNCGQITGSYSYIDSNGNTWDGDSDYTISVNGAGSGDDISNTNNNDDNTIDAIIYQSERFQPDSDDLSYEINDLMDATYDIILHFAETWFEDSGSRTFGIIIQDEQITSSIDLYNTYGHDVATAYFNTFEITDGTLDIIMTRAVENPIINGIEVIQSLSSQSSAVYINCGYNINDYIDGDNNEWVKDFGFIDDGSTTSISTSDNIIDSGDFNNADTVFKNARVSNSDGGIISYSIEETGLFDVVLLFAEIEDLNIGERIMKIEIEDKVYLENFDILSNVGKNSLIGVLCQDVTVLDGTLDIKIIGTNGKAIINGIYFNQQSNHFAHAVIPRDIENGIEIEYYKFEDLNDDGYVTIRLDGSGSHTHYAGATLLSYNWVWSQNGVSIGSATEETPQVTISTGTYDLSLTVLDSAGFEHTDNTVLDILPGSGYDGCLAYYYDYSDDSSLLTSLPDLSIADRTPLLVIEDDINFDFQSHSAQFGNSGLTGNFAAQFICYIDVEDGDNGDYEFSLESNDGSKLYIDNSLIINNDGVMGDNTYNKISGTVSLNSGRHYIRIEYFDIEESSAGKVLNLYWKPPYLTNEEILPSIQLHYGLFQKLSIIEESYPLEGTYKGGVDVTFSGKDFLWNPNRGEINVVIIDELGDIVEIDSSSLTWSNINTGSLAVTLPQHGSENYDVNAKLYISTPAGYSNGVNFKFQHDAFNAPDWDQVKTLDEGPTFTVLEFGPDGKLYASDYDGNIYRYELSYNADDMTYNIVTKIISTVLIDNMNHKPTVLGIAFNPNDNPLGNDGNGPIMYVTHSWMYHYDTNLNLAQDDPLYTDKHGYITSIYGENLDSFSHIVTGLPVSEHDHGVNGIIFLPNGIMCTNIGGVTNGGIPGGLSTSKQQDERYYSAGTVCANIYDNNFNGNLKYDSEGFPISFNNGIFLYSAGLRNSFDLVYHPKYDVIYATDNGPNTNFGEESASCDEGTGNEANAIDKFIKLTYGGYYGHANRLRGSMTDNDRECTYRDITEESDDGYTQPIAAYGSSINGILVYSTNNFGGQWKDSIIIGNLVGDLERVIIDEDNDELITRPTLNTDGNFEKGLDVTTDYRGTVFMTKYLEWTGGTNTISYVVPIDDKQQYGSLFIVSVTPSMGPIQGGRTITIRGYNIINNGVSVKFGSKLSDSDPECSITEISTDNEFDTIKCITPDYSSHVNPGEYATVSLFVKSDGEEFILHNSYTFVTKLSVSPKRGVTSWIPKVSLPKSLVGMSCASIDSNSYIVFGGTDNNDNINEIIYKYNIINDEWIELSFDGSYGKDEYQTIEVYNNEIYLFGGSSLSTSSSMKKYNPSTDTWTLLSECFDDNGNSYSPFSASSGIIDNKIYISGGLLDDNTISDKLFVYDILNNNCNELLSHPDGGRYSSSSIGYNGLFYVFGGKTDYDTPDNSAYVYNPNTNTWNSLEDIPVATSENGQLISLHDKLLLIGGEGLYDTLDYVQSYDVEFNEWSYMSDMITPRFGISPVIVDDMIFVVGGDQVIGSDLYTDVHEALVYL